MKNPLVRGLVVVLAVAALLTVGFFLKQGKAPELPVPGTNKTIAQYTPVTVSGILGSDKESLITDPEVAAILWKEYKIKVPKENVKIKSQFELTNEDMSGKDFVWHSSRISLDFYKEKKLPLRKEAIIIRSPLVFDAWLPAVEAMEKQKMVEKQGETYYLTTAGLNKLSAMMIEQKEWSEIKLPFYGPVNIGSCDPKQTNSGLMFYAIVGSSLNGGKLLTSGNMYDVLPKLQQYYSSQGALPSKNQWLLESFLQKGAGDNPMIATYESELQEFALEHPSDVPFLKKNIRVLYPKPTIWSEHIFVSTTENGDRLLEALKDPAIQKIAWEKHGFRTGLIGGVNNDPKLQILGAPVTIDSVMPLPKSEVMHIIREQL